MTDSQKPTAAALAELFRLSPMPLEGGLFRRTWSGAPQDDGRAAGSAIMVLLSAEDDTFSAMHRLPGDEVWHHYLGAPVELVLLHPDGGAEVVVLGPDVLNGQQVQLIIPGGTWMGGSVAPGGDWSLFGCTMAPGFVAADYEGGEADDLCARYPRLADRIRALCRPGQPLRHPADASPDLVVDGPEG
ncbi:cupin domain-containing protein [Kitasatospora griseola]|uniref:cupin domain-containing protein n=1 Tax=Kitasatospora griseola TaxID=2064 RepID=UPI00380593C0